MKNKRLRTLKTLTPLILLVLISPSVMAATPVEDAINWVLDLLTNGIARSVAIIAIVVLGFVAMSGRLEWKVVGFFLLGIVFIFGGATMIDLLIGVVS